MWKKNKQEEIHPDWERGVVRKLAFAAIEEQRRSRRWGIFFKFLTFAYLLTLLLLWMPDKLPGTGLKVSGKHTALVDVTDVDGTGNTADQKHQGRHRADQQSWREPGAGCLHPRRDRAAES